MKRIQGRVEVRTVQTIDRSTGRPIPLFYAECSRDGRIYQRGPKRATREEAEADGQRTARRIAILL